jgi:multicomponent K+:H+ antiporter subunit G
MMGEDMPLYLEIAVAALLVIAGVFGLVGSYGLLKLDNPMARLHAPTKATTIGVGGVLIASMLHVWATDGRVSFHELLITLFLFATAPVTANYLAKMHVHRMIDRKSLPLTGTGAEWATLPVQVDAAAATGAEPAPEGSRA